MGVVINIDPNPEGVDVYLDGVRTHVEPGGSLKTTAARIGRPPSGTPGEGDYDPGEGLLAAVDCWAPPGPPPDSSTGGDTTNVGSS